MSEEDLLKFLKQEDGGKESGNNKFSQRRNVSTQENNMNNYADFTKATSNVLNEKKNQIVEDFAKCKSL
jgi:hypothetical protein